MWLSLELVSTRTACVPETEHSNHTPPRSSTVRSRVRRRGIGSLPTPALNPESHAIEIEIHDRRGVQREELTEQESPHDRDAQRPAQFRPVAVAERERQGAEHRREGG